MRTYIAGPMRGIQQYNFLAFDTAAERLRSIGRDVVSPAELDRLAGFDPYKLPADTDWSHVPVHFSLEAAIRRDVEAILGCDSICVLPGWEKSVGATAEVAIAKWRGMVVETYVDCVRNYMAR